MGLPLNDATDNLLAERGTHGHIEDNACSPKSLVRSPSQAPNSENLSGGKCHPLLGFASGWCCASKIGRILSGNWRRARPLARYRRLRHIVAERLERKTAADPRKARLLHHQNLLHLHRPLPRYGASTNPDRSPRDVGTMGITIVGKLGMLRKRGPPSLSSALGWCLNKMLEGGGVGNAATSRTCSACGLNLQRHLKPLR